MKLLLDANLSWRMVAILKQHFEDCVHSDFALYEGAKDREIWEFARQNNFMIVTNDEDFIDLVNLKGFPPKIILIKTGNQSRSSISNLIIEHKKDIEALMENNEIGLLEIITVE